MCFEVKVEGRGGGLESVGCDWSGGRVDRERRGNKETKQEEGKGCEFMRE